MKGVISILHEQCHIESSTKDMGIEGKKGGKKSRNQETVKATRLLTRLKNFKENEKRKRGKMEQKKGRKANLQNLAGTLLHLLPSHRHSPSTPS